MIVAVGCDHGGFELKPVIIAELRRLGHTVADCGAPALDPDDDYPDIAAGVAGAVRRGEAARGARDYGLAYYDAQIWAAARLNQVQIVLSEDFQDGQTLEGVRFANPFGESFVIEEWI